jgi:hypothetical protein
VHGIAFDDVHSIAMNRNFDSDDVSVSILLSEAHPAVSHAEQDCYSWSFHRDQVLDMKVQSVCHSSDNERGRFPKENRT